MRTGTAQPLTWVLSAALLVAPGWALAGLQLAPEQADAVSLNRWLSAAASQGGPRCTEPRVVPPLPQRLRGHVTLSQWRCGLRSQPGGEVRRHASVQLRLAGARYLRWPVQRVEWEEEFTLDSDATLASFGLRMWVGATQAQALPAWQSGGAGEEAADGSWERWSNAGGTLATLRCGPRGAAPCEIGEFLVP